MRLQKKYKKFAKLSFVFKEFPNKLLKLHRTKWKKIQQTLIKKNTGQLLNTTKTLITTKRWVSYKSKYSEGVKLKKYFDCLYDRSFSVSFFKKLKFLNKKLKKTLELSAYFIKPEFRIDLFLWRLKFFSSSYEARRYINNRQVLVNQKKIHPNYFLKKGDIISFDFLSFFKNSNFKNILLKNINNNKLLPFVEIDYYTNTVIFLKNYNQLTEQEMIFFVSNFLSITKFKSFIE